MSAFGWQLYRDTMTNFARVVSRKIDSTLKNEHSRQSEFKTASEKVWKPRGEERDSICTMNGIGL